MGTIGVSFYRHVRMTGMPMCAMPGEKTVLTNFQLQWINGRTFPVFNYSLWANMLNAANFRVAKQNLTGVQHTLNHIQSSNSGAVSSPIKIKKGFVRFSRS